MRKAIPIPELSDSFKAQFMAGVRKCRAFDECWPWGGAKTSFGHGRVKIDGRLYSPHRVAYAIKHGPIPPRTNGRHTVIMHECDNPACCNPHHLTLGTHRENNSDMYARGRGPLGRNRGVFPSMDGVSGETISAVRSAGLSERSLMKQFGLSQRAIRHILKERV